MPQYFTLEPVWTQFERAENRFLTLSSVCVQSLSEHSAESRFPRASAYTVRASRKQIPDSLEALRKQFERAGRRFLTPSSLYVNSSGETSAES